MKIYKFHQFVTLDKGPINTCISDLLKGEIYQVPNNILDKFEKQEYEEIPDFICTLKEADLIIQVEKDTWILPLYFKNRFDTEKQPVTLELEEGVDIAKAINFFLDSQLKIKLIHFFGSPDKFCASIDVPIVIKVKDFTGCLKASEITEDFPYIDEMTYILNRFYHNCWGQKIAVTADGNIHPCIYSQLIIGNIYKNIFSEIWEAAEKLRRLTKDKVEKCKNCEFLFVCFDCREIARIRGGSLYSKNPNCKYDPFKGTWS